MVDQNLAPLDEALTQLTASLAKSDAEAATRAATWKGVDPFPAIPPSLLNSADICAYVAAIGMIHPFYPRREHLKPASYALRLLGRSVSWDEKGDKVVKEIGESDEFDLRPNSIAFVTLEPQLRLPDYIALRFNLKILNVYRGLLLGTGPLVDPGFEGRLSIPLHNLTNNTYRFRGGEAIIWVEFTKLSPNPRWSGSGADAQERILDSYVPYPLPERPRVVDDYLREAHQGPIASSLPRTFRLARDAAKKARAAANRVQIGAAVTATVGILGALGVIWAAFNLARGFTQDARQEVRSHQAAGDTLERRVSELERTLDSIVAGWRGPATARPN